MTNQKDNTENHGTITTQAINSQQTQESSYSAEDIGKSKTMAGLSYFIFFLPLLACPDSKYAKFHANQSLLLLITSIAGNVILGIIPVIGWMLLPVFGVAMLILVVMGLINGFGGKAKELPIIGKFTILK